MARQTRRTDRKRKGTLGRVATAAARQKGKIQWLKLDDGDVAVVRVLDAGENFKDAYVHRVPMEKEDGDTYYADVPCLDQDDKGVPCPGCKEDIPRRYKFWANVIVRDWEDEAGDEKDTLMVWSGGITVAKRLDKLDARFGGLDKRDVEVEREGKGKNDTKYEVEPATDENEPLTDEDKDLKKQKSHDLTRYTTPPAFDDFFIPVSERDKDDDDEVGEKSRRRGSAFKRRDKSDDDGDDGERKTSARRRSSNSKSSSKPQLRGFGNKTSGDDSKTTVRRRRSR